MATLAILVMWAGIGALLSFGMFLTGNSYARKHPGRLPDVTASKIRFSTLFVCLFLWPPLLLTIAKALKNKRHPLEQIYLEVEADRQEQLEKEERALKAFRAEIPLSSKWTFSPSTSGVRIRNDLYIDHANQGFTVRPTHSVTSYFGVFVSLRVLAPPKDMSKVPPFQVLGERRSLKDAQALCDQDTEWCALCAPAKETERKEFWDKSPDNFDPNTMDQADLERIFARKRALRGF